MNGEMTGREIVNLIDILQREGMSDSKIISIIKYIELTNPKAANSLDENEKELVTT